MFLIGKPSVKAARICKVAHECLLIGIEKVKPGVHLGEIGRAIGAHAKVPRIVQLFVTIVVMELV